MWNLLTNQCVHTLMGHENGVHVLGLPDSIIASTSTGEAVNGKPANFRFHILKFILSRITDLMCPHRLRFWNADTGSLISPPIDDHAGSIRSIAAVSGIGGFVTTSNDGTVVSFRL